MGLPSKKRTPRSKKERAAHFALKKVTLTKCANCGSKAQPHQACTNCGEYKGRKALNVEKRAARAKRHAKKTK